MKTAGMQNESSPSETAATEEPSSEPVASSSSEHSSQPPVSGNECLELNEIFFLKFYMKGTFHGTVNFSRSTHSS